MPTMYRLKISLVQPHYPITKLHRVLEISGNASFFDLHERIFEAFDRWDKHAFQFFISRTKMDSFGSLFDDCTEIVMIDEFMEQHEDVLGREIQLHPASQTTLDELNLQEKDYFYYWFDFGDDWLHRIRIEKIFEDKEELEQGVYFAAVIKSVGESPEQYPEHEEEPFSGKEEFMQLPKEFKILSTLMMIVQQPIYWGHVVGVRMADELVKLGFIEPCKNDDDIVHITEKGLQELDKHLNKLSELSG